LQIGCAVERPDALLWPGGPATFLVSAPWFFAVKAQVEFLVVEHELTRIIAVAHLDCLFYRRKYPSLSSDERVQQQEKDLRAFRDQASQIKAGLKIDLYYEEPIDGRIQYRPVA
jgi:hypothetical protein